MLNPSFEDTISCPDALFQIDRATGWSSYKQSPDYFNSCSDQSTLVSVPDNFLGSQYPASGNAYAGFQTFFTPGTREIIGAQLSAPLNIGLKYFVTFKIVLSGLTPASGSSVNCCTNKIGALFSTISYNVSNPIPINNFADIYTDSIICDTINWVTIRGFIVPNQAFQYIAFGNFFDDANTDTIIFNAFACRAYYYIDDICVSTDSLLCEIWTGIDPLHGGNNITVYPNPFNNNLFFTMNNNSLSSIILYDITSRKIFNQSFTNSISINTSHLSKGIYIYEVRSKNGVLKKGKVVKD